MIIRNDVRLLSALAYLAGRRETEDRNHLNVPMAIGITKSYVAFASLLAEKRIII
ncbi:hypothetical protein J2X69_004218 [Algoriphagus sp. 4150]|uniref:hypothetical protein n=1 Tax=Algoriphagus sp. 4150 TaxID=2817756 RepID=UPI00285F4F3C|nr:hypothetical protein [Algoriphagus sp. 4150]MDR7131853.1 hypothetical protein [Algoriphagus sp. 4150]